MTQTPELPEGWDLRFSSITDLPGTEGEPQRFLYSTRLGFGLQIKGAGESVGEATGADGSRSSALKFWSEDPKSLIREGAGFWKYLPDKSGVTFLPCDNSRARFGTAGRLLDGMLFGPLRQRATAWSFDRLRPETALRNGAVYALARGAVAAGGIYSGLVPKLLGPHKDELVLLAATGIGNTRTAAVAFGLAEVIFGLLVVVCWKARWPPSAEARCGGCGTAGSSRCRFWSSGLPAASYSPNRRKMFRLR